MVSREMSVPEVAERRTARGHLEPAKHHQIATTRAAVIIAIVATPYLIFVLFSPQTNFLIQLFSTPKRVNSDKTDFATKQRKSLKRDIATKQHKMRQ